VHLIKLIVETMNESFMGIKWSCIFACDGKKKTKLMELRLEGKCSDRKRVIGQRLLVRVCMETWNPGTQVAYWAWNCWMGPPQVEQLECIDQTEIKEISGSASQENRNSEANEC